MATQNAIGTIAKTVLEKSYEETHIEWKLRDFIALSEFNGVNVSCNSPTFFVNNVRCHFNFLVRPSSWARPYELFLFTNELPEDYSGQYKLNFNTSDRSTEGKINGIPGSKESVIDVSEFIVSELSKGNFAQFVRHSSIILTVKREIPSSIQSSILDTAIQNNLIKLDKLSENFKDLFDDKETCDTTLKVKDKEYKVHRSVLIARSSVFAFNFKHDTMERQTGVITILDCDPDSFEMFLEYLYSGKLEQLSSSGKALNLYYTSDKYDIQDVKTFCLEYLMKHLTLENICEVAAFADKYDEMKLFTAVQNFFNCNVCAILVSPEWDCLLTKDHRLANKLMIEMSKVIIKGGIS